MNKTLDEHLEELKDKSFHGSVTIHYANGIPKKIELKAVSELKQ